MEIYTDSSQIVDLLVAIGALPDFKIGVEPPIIWAKYPKFDAVMKEFSLIHMLFCLADPFLEYLFRWVFEHGLISCR